MVGKLVGKYQVISELAQGRLGPVYRAQLATQPAHQSYDTQREVILKTVNFNLFTKSLQVQLKARFRREIFAQRQLTHRNIVAVYEFLNVGNDYYLVCENFPGATLRDLLMRQGVPNAVEAVSYGRQMLTALDYAHRLSYLDESDFQRAGIVHGDVRLSNLILDARGRVKLTDFSVIHKVIGGELRKLYPELIAYQSPEMQRGSAPDLRSDVFAAGAAFYEMLTGRLPGTATVNEDWRYAQPQSDVEAEALLAIRQDVPPALAAAISRAVRRHPADRFATIGEFLKAVHAVEAELTGTEAGTRAKGTIAEIAQPERLATADFMAAMPVTASAPQPPVSLLKMRKPEATVTSYRSTYASALPADTSFDIAPPTLGRRRERWLLPAFIACALGGTLAGAYFFSSPRSNEGLASNVPSAAVSPVSAASEAPLPMASLPVAAEMKLAPLLAATPESPKLAFARQAEQQERYGEALKAYEEYAAANPNTAVANNTTGRIAALRQFQSLLNNAKSSYAAGNYDEARAQFSAAQRLRPTSRTAQAGLMESGSRIATPLTVPAMAPRTETPEKRATEEPKTPLENVPPTENTRSANEEHVAPRNVAKPKPLAPTARKAPGSASGTLRRAPLPARPNKPLVKPNGGGLKPLAPKPAGAKVVKAVGAKIGKSAFASTGNPKPPTRQ